MTIVENCRDAVLLRCLLVHKPVFSVLCTHPAQTVATVERVVPADFPLRRLAATVSCCRIFVIACDQQATESVQVATQNGQLQVTFETNLQTVATAFQCVATLQHADR